METPCLAVGRHNTDTNQTGGNCLCVCLLAAGRLYTHTQHTQKGALLLLLLLLLTYYLCGRVAHLYVADQQGVMYDCLLRQQRRRRRGVFVV